MSRSPKRPRQIADVIRHQLALILKKHVRDPRLVNVTIIKVDVSPDLGNAKVFFSVPDVNELQNVARAFAKCTPYLRHQLAEYVDLRYVPQLRFVFDHSLERGSKISALIDEAISKDQKRNPDNDDSSNQEN